MKRILFISALLLSFSSFAQNRMTPELLWKLGRVSGLGISKDGKYVLYSVSTPNAAENKSSRKTYALPLIGGEPIPVSNADSMLNNDKISPDGKYIISSDEVKIKNVTGKDYYPELQKSNVYIFDKAIAANSPSSCPETVKLAARPKKSFEKSTSPPSVSGGFLGSKVVTRNISPAPSASLAVMMGECI